MTGAWRKPVLCTNPLIMARWGQHASQQGSQAKHIPSKGFLHTNNFGTPVLWCLEQGWLCFFLCHYLFYLPSELPPAARWQICRDWDEDLENTRMPQNNNVMKWLLAAWQNRFSVIIFFSETNWALFCSEHNGKVIPLQWYAPLYMNDSPFSVLLSHSLSLNEKCRCKSQLQLKVIMMTIL